MIHNVLPTHAKLYRDGISESLICSLRNVEEQTLRHLLIDCTLTVDFWTLFQDWWCQKTNETIMLSMSHGLYGCHDRTKHWQVLNYCLLMPKYYIFCASLRIDDLDFQSFLLLILRKHEIWFGKHFNFAAEVYDWLIVSFIYIFSFSHNVMYC